MYKIGLTGGIGSGKSFIARIFESLDIPVYYADTEAKRLMLKNKLLKNKIKDLLGIEAYHRNGRPNRAYIAGKIFNDSKLLKKMNGLVHPAVRKDFEIWSENQNSPYVIEESALLFEIKSQQQFDKIVLVIADVEERIRRVIKRDKTTRDSVLLRMKKQLKDEKKIPLADFVIDNSGNKSILRQVYKIHKKILKNI